MNYLCVSILIITETFKFTVPIKSNEQQQLSLFFLLSFPCSLFLFMVHSTRPSVAHTICLQCRQEGQILNKEFGGILKDAVAR
jgi:hypothetical protein